MGDLTKNISRSEMACKCGCGFDAADIQLVEAIQDCCNHFAQEQHIDKVVLTITSGNRCKEHNAKEGGAEKSQHVYGKGADFYIRNVSAKDVADYLEGKYPDSHGIGRYSNRTHLDVRAEKARWDMRAK